MKVRPAGMIILVCHSSHSLLLVLMIFFVVAASIIFSSSSVVSPSVSISLSGIKQLTISTKSNMGFYLVLCLCLFEIIPALTTTVPADLLSLLLQAESERTSTTDSKSISITVAYHKAHLAHYGAIIDEFIGPRPWYEVKTEPYQWHDYPEGHETAIILHRLPSSKYDSILQSISDRQYPPDCSRRRLSVTMTEGFDSFGNVFYNYNNEASQNHFAVYVPYINDPKTQHTNFLDPGSCPNTHNKFECAFLSPTNCSLPPLESHHKYYSDATVSAKEISKQEFEHTKHNNSHFKLLIESTVFGGLAEDDGPLKGAHKNNRHAYQSLFTYGFLFRLNYLFRGLMALETERFEDGLRNVSVSSSSSSSSSVSFPKDGNCVTINIRKDPDRAPVNIKNVSEFCMNCSLGVTECRGSKFHNYGCHTANPYGSISLDDFIQGAKVISNATILYITTDNLKWLNEALFSSNFTMPKGYTILPYGAPPKHRKCSSASGVQYLVSLLQSRKCNAFVGNSGSAVSALYMNLLCVQHGDMFGGECPAFFDFSHRHNVPNFDDSWRKLPKN